MNAEHERLLQFLYLCPLGVAEVNAEGRVQLLNALGIQLWLPVAGPDGLDDMFFLLERHAPEVRAAIEEFPKRTGTVCQSRVVSLEGVAAPTWFSFTVHKIQADSLLIAFLDVTTQIEEQRRAQVALEQEAIQKGKFELAAGVLHDVGNAVTGVGTRVARMLGECEWEECLQLRKLGTFIEQQRSSLAQALGDPKAQALETFAGSITTALEQRRLEYQQNLQFLTRALAHVQEVLNIQRIYVRHRPGAEADLRDLVSDAIMIQQASLDKRDVRVVVDFPRDLPQCSLDRTRFLQVLVNLIKNACESFDQCPSGNRELRFQVRTRGAQVTLTLTDNGAGFAPDEGRGFFDRGQTTKANGTGYGLANCRQIVAAHGGTVDLNSPGPGQGASVTVTLPINLAEEKEVLCSAP